MACSMHNLVELPIDTHCMATILIIFHWNGPCLWMKFQDIFQINALTISSCFCWSPHCHDHCTIFVSSSLNNCVQWSLPFTFINIILFLIPPLRSLPHCWGLTYTTCVGLLVLKSVDEALLFGTQPQCLACDMSGCVPHGHLIMPSHHVHVWECLASWFLSCWTSMNLIIYEVKIVFNLRISIATSSTKKRFTISFANSACENPSSPQSTTSAEWEQTVTK